MPAQIISLPVIPALPNLSSYGVDRLYLFVDFSDLPSTSPRKAYFGQYGVEAPPFDAGRKAQGFFFSDADVSDPLNVTPFYVLARDGAGNPLIKQHLFNSLNLLTVNLPDENKTYPAYVVAPTGAMVAGEGNLNAQPVQVGFLSSHIEALRIMREVGGTAVLEGTLGDGVIFSPNETRRLFEIVFNGRRTNAGLLIGQQYGHGIGAPGHWNLQGLEPAWVPDASVIADVNATHVWEPVPLRQLDPKEHLAAFGGGVIQVQRVDLQAQTMTAAGNFSSIDHDAIARIDSGVQRCIEILQQGAKA